MIGPENPPKNYTGNPNDYHGFYFVTYDYGTFYHADRTMGGYRHYLHYLEKGRVKIVTSAGTLEATAGDLFYLPMDLSYESYWSDEENAKVYSCGFRIFPEARNTSFALQLLPHRFVKKFLEIPLQIQPDTVALAKFYGLLAELLPIMEVDHRTSGSALLEKIKTYIWKYPTKNMEEVARYCGMSRSSLYTKVKEVSGKTLHQIKQEIQVERAKDFLLNSNSSINLFSEEIGFCNPTHLRKVFKAHTGMTPRQFRMQARQK